MAKGDKLNVSNLKRKYSNIDEGLTNLKSLINMQVKLEEKDKNFGSYKIISNLN